MAKMNFYRSSVRVPLIVRPPGGRDGQARLEELVAALTSTIEADD